MRAHCVAVALTLLLPFVTAAQPPFAVLDPASFSPLYQEDLSWAAASTPLFEASERNLTLAYAFRWRTFKRHIHNVANGTAFDWVVTEFTPNVPWAGRDNTIPCAAGHHVNDGRWLRDGASATSGGAVMDSYSLWWVSGLGGIRLNYYLWLASSILARMQVAGVPAYLPLVAPLLPKITDTVLAYMSGGTPGGSCSHWDATNDGIYSWPGCQGQEHNLAGGGLQPTIHAMMVSEGRALARLCDLAGNATCAAQFTQLAAQFQARLLRTWNPALQSFDTLNSSLAPKGTFFSGVRTLASLTSPWYYAALPSANASAYAASWDTAWDANGLGGPFGLRTAEKRNPAYSCHPKDCCYWGGPVWPYETAKAVTGAANVLHDAALAAAVPNLSRARLWDMLSNYTNMHTPQWIITNWTNGAPANYSLINSTVAPGSFLSGLGFMWIAEDGCAETAQWTDNLGGGYWYQHSTYMNNVLETVVGLVPRAADPTPSVLVQPLQPADDTLQWWCLDGALIGGKYFTIAWDADGSRYGRGEGLTVWVDGVVAAHASTTQGPGVVVPL